MEGGEGERREKLFRRLKKFFPSFPLGLHLSRKRGDFVDEEFVQLHYDKIYRYCYFKLKNRQIAEDLTQEAFLRFLGQKTYIHQNKPLAYLYTVAKNLCVDYLRKEKRCVLEELEEAEDCLAHNPIAEAETKSVIQAAVQSLSEEQQELVLLRYVNDLKLDDLVKLTGGSRFSVYRKLKAAVAGLKKLIRKEDFFE